MNKQEYIVAMLRCGQIFTDRIENKPEQINRTNRNIIQKGRSSFCFYLFDYGDPEFTIPTELYSIDFSITRMSTAQFYRTTHANVCTRTLQPWIWWEIVSPEEYLSSDGIRKPEGWRDRKDIKIADRVSR